MMPKMNGFEVCRALRTEADVKGSPILLLTVRGQKVDRQTIFTDSVTTGDVKKCLFACGSELSCDWARSGKMRDWTAKSGSCSSAPSRLLFLPISPRRTEGQQ